MAVRAAIALLLSVATPAVAQPLPVVPGAQVGVLVTTLDGTVIAEASPDARFVPASNTKIATTIAAFARPPVRRAGTGVRIDDARDVILVGRGDASLSSRADCADRCLSLLADAIGARTRRVRDVVGDARVFADERWPQGMSWNNIPTVSGTATAALGVDAHEERLIVTPGAVGQMPAITDSGYFRVVNRAVTVAGDGVAIDWHRHPEWRTITLTGTIGATAAPATLALGIDDPAHHAAWRLASLLHARGVRVTGTVRSRYRAPGLVAPMEDAAPDLATIDPPDDRATVAAINKDSQNLFAELLLRRLDPGGTAAAGQAVVASVLAEAGVPSGTMDFADGGGMSTYNRVTPRAMVQLLRWAHARPWGLAFRASLAVAGVDGTLKARFTGTPLAGRLVAKTGALNATAAIAGYLPAASGRTLVFAIYANDIPPGVRATPAIDAYLNAIAATH